MVGAGKAAATMSKAVEDNWDGLLEGLVVTRYGHAIPCERIEVVEASHPVPDAAGKSAARRILDMLGGLTADGLILALISGGGSSLLSLPSEGQAESVGAHKTSLLQDAEFGCSLEPDALIGSSTHSEVVVLQRCLEQANPDSGSHHHLEG